MSVVYMSYVCMQVYLSHGHPVPPIPYKWHEKRFPIATGWDTIYDKQL